MLSDSLLFHFLLFNSRFDLCQSLCIYFSNLLVSEDGILLDLSVSINLILPLLLLFLLLESCHCIHLLLVRVMHIFDSSLLLKFVRVQYFVKLFFLFSVFDLSFEFIINFPGGSGLLDGSDSCGLTMGMGY